jgi:pimeloyl-ACP methyl ester carboxylesterase
LNAAIFSKPHHQLSEATEKMLIDYELFAITRYKDNTQKPYDMDDELRRVKSETYLLLGDKDLLFPVQKSIDNAKSKFESLRDLKVFPNVGHGIETFGEALKYVGEMIEARKEQ